MTHGFSSPENTPRKEKKQVLHNPRAKKKSVFCSSAIYFGFTQSRLGVFENFFYVD